MSGLQARGDEGINGVDVREQGNTLRVATNTPHLVSLGTGRLSTAVTLHPIKQGRVTVGSDPTCDIYVVGSGVASVHCRVENSHGVVTLYPVAGSTLVDSTPVLKPTRLSQGSMLSIGRTNYLRFNHPAEAMLMKSVLPTARRDITAGYVNVTHTDSQCYQQTYKQISDEEPSKELSRTKPPIAPKDEKLNSIMSKVSKFEYYAKQQKSVGRSQFYTNNESEISPKVFSSNSLTVNTPAIDVLGGKTIPNYMKKNDVIIENNTVETKGSYVNVAIRNNTKINEIVKNFDDNKLKKVNNDLSDSVYGKINNEKNTERNDSKYHDFSINDRSYKDTSFEISKSNLQSRDYTRKQEFLNNQDVPRTQDRNLDVSRSIDTRNQFSTSSISNHDHFRNQHNPETSKSHLRTNAGRQETSRSPELDMTRSQESSRSVDKTERSRSQDRYAESSRSQEKSLINGIGVPQYSPVYVNQYERAENMRVKAYQERVKEEEKKEAEMERLEEILDIFTEYQKQLTTDTRPGIPVTPTEREKRPHNKIITNGSLPRSVAFNNPNFVKTSDGFYKFETSQSRPELPRNMSSYENFEPHTPEVTLPENYENVGRMDEIGIPVFDSPGPTYEEYQNIDETTKNPSPKTYQHINAVDAVKDQSINNVTLDQNNKTPNPIGSPYENLYTNRPVHTGLKPKSPNTSSPRTRIKTTFAHKNTTPQYFVFPTPPVDTKANYDVSRKNDDNSRQTSRNIEDPKLGLETSRTNNEVKDNLRSNKVSQINDQDTYKPKEGRDIEINKNEKIGIEKQLSLEEDIPMIDDTEITNDIECRYSNIIKNDTADLPKNQSFEDVKKELMADIPELEAFENELKTNKREKLIKHITEDIKTIDIEAESVLDVNIEDLKDRYEKLKEERRKMVTEIHEVKCKMTEITTQEDDILRELEMEKALIKGEYDSEIAILKIEQKKKSELIDKVKRIEEEIKTLKDNQESRQNEISDRVEIATRKVERLEKDVKHNAATLEELQNARDILDNESKIYEDLEFQHLEEESELLSNREDLQNEIIHLTKKIDAQKTRILTLKSEANNNLTSALDDTKILHTEYVTHLNNVEKLTAKVQTIEKELKPIVAKLNEIERAQSPDSAFYTDQTRAKSGDFGYSPETSDEDINTKITNFQEHTRDITDKLKSIDRMSQSMSVDIEKRIDNPKSKKGFWERNFDSLKRKKKPKSPEKVDVMSQSLNENFLYSECVEDTAFERFGSLRNSKKKDKGPMKSNSSSKIPTFAALGKIIKKDSFGKKGDDDKSKFIKNGKGGIGEGKYKSKSLSPDKGVEDKTPEKISEEEEDAFQTVKVLHRKSCGDEPSARDFGKISDSGKIPSQDDIDRISKVTIDAPLLSSDTDVNTLGKRTLDSLLEVERKRFEMLEEQGCQMIENEREKISELKRRAQDETKKLWDQKYREKSVDSDFNSLTDDRRHSLQSTDSRDRLHSDKQHKETLNNDPEQNMEKSPTEKFVSFDRSHEKSPSLDLSAHEMSRDKSFDSSREQSLPSRDKSCSDRASHEKSQERSYVDRTSRNPQRSVTFDQNDKRQERTVNFDLSKCLNQSIDLSNHEQLSVMTVNFDRSVTDKFERQEMLDFDRSMEFDRSGQFDRSMFDQTDDSFIEDGFMVNSTIYEESSGLVSSSIEELQVRNSRTESTEDEKRSDDSRPLSHASDFSRDHILSLSNAPRRSRRGVAPCNESQRPLTRYLPVDRDDFDLRSHVESAGHQIDLCPYVMVTSSTCRGYLHKLGAKFHTWSKRWFVFDRETKTFVYYWDKSEKKPRGGAYFQVIEEVYLDHGNTSKSPSPQTTFIVKTRQRRYYLMAPSGEAARIWIDAIFTGAQGYTEYLE